MDASVSQSKSLKTIESEVMVGGELERREVKEKKKSKEKKTE